MEERFTNGYYHGRDGPLSVSLARREPAFSLALSYSTAHRYVVCLSPRVVHRTIIRLFTESAIDVRKPWRRRAKHVSPITDWFCSRPTDETREKTHNRREQRTASLSFLRVPTPTTAFARNCRRDDACRPVRRHEDRPRRFRDNRSFG